jgi:hypothetical protein
MIVAWPAFKSFIDAKYLSIQWTEDEHTYFLKALDGAFTMECNLSKDNQNEHLSQFEATYKALGNQSFSDIDGIPFARLKASKKGWSFWAVPIELTTSCIGGSVYCKDAGGTDIPGITCKIYNGSGVEITVPGLLDVNLATCTTTILDFEPAFDYEMIGGALRINSNPSQDVRLWVVGAPDIPAIYGGSKEFASGVNLKFMAPDSSFEIDGRVTKYVTYNASTHQGKLRIILKHPAGSNINLQFIIHTYRL